DNEAEENLPRYARKRRGVASSVLNNEDAKPVAEEYREIKVKDNIPRRNKKVSGVMMDTTIENRKPAVRNDIHEITVKNTENEPVLERTYVRSDALMDSVVAPAIHEEKNEVSEITFNKGGADIQTDAYDDAVTAEPANKRSTQSRSNPSPVRNRKYKMPTADLLNKSSSQGAGSSKDELLDTARNLMDTLNTFGVKAKVTDISQGPSVTRYELQPEVGVRVNKIVSLSDDLKLALAATDIRIEAPIPGKSAVGIEVPNKVAGAVSFRELIEDKTFKNFDSKIAFAVGKDIAGNVVVTDIAKMPHMLIAGATGSGKSVCINTIIMSILYKANPDEVKLIMIDPKVVELSVYNGIPHLMVPVVTDPKKAAAALHWGVAEMTKRYQLFAEMNVRDLKGYNKAVENNSPREDEEKREKLPQIVIIVDELADLMMVAAKEVEESICRLAQLARACGIHLVIATQRPSVDVITGLIKANMPSRVAFAVSSGTDSRTILDMNGAEKLLGKGDMLFFPQGYPKPARIQGAFISDSEVSQVVDFLRSQNYGDNNGEDLLIKMDTAANMSGSISGDDDRDELFEPAGRFIIESDKASIGSLQRKFKIGFNRAARIMDQLSDAGVVGPEEGTKPRQILMNMSQFDDCVNY
ncbi:MAG: DNA translocase FtsK, partial [Lachnospiraceae bacterium]|nr:DNA translocase FtsK [Lachnospiraceae bacterium]